MSMKIDARHRDMLLAIFFVMCFTLLSALHEVMPITKTPTNRSRSAAITNGFHVLQQQLDDRRFGESTLIISNEGIVAWTNAVRREAGLAPLNSSPILDAIAKKRAKDMVRTGFYGHTSINGFGADDMARYFQYRYLRYAENLAVGPFVDSRSAVELWMNSASHRANILNTRFHEIGAAVDEGWIEGRQRIVAVEVFGLPVEHCPKIDESLVGVITAETVHQKEMERAAITMRTAISLTQDPVAIAAYNDFIAKLRYRVSEINRLTSEYNTQVKAFNECI